MKLPAALAPLEGPVFRGLWFAWLAANMTMWMNDVAAAWLMTTLTTSPAMVALVQTASTLPVFLLGLPSGAMADIVDRRLYFAGTQMWVSLVALLIAALAVAGLLTPSLLLLLTFLNGIGLAMRWPVFSAIVPEVVGRAHLPAALALNGISMNMSRVVGPVVAGALLASAGTAAVFVLNAVLAGVAFVLILRWRSEPRTSALPGERFVGAMRVGLQHVRQSPRMRAVIVRVFLFFLQSSALLALLPLVAKGLEGGGAGSFTLLMASMGAGAICAALLFPRWRRRFNRDQFVRYGSIVQAAAAAIAAFVPELWMAVPAVFVSGMAWISTANTLAMSAQFALPNWVRARGMAIYQMALMAGTAFGAMAFGKLAGLVGVAEAIAAASLLGAALLPWAQRWSVEGEDADFTPAVPRAAAEPAIDIEPDAGPVMVTVEYQVDDADVPEFTALMQLTRAARLRQGALSWALFRDTAQPGRWVEHFVDENWIEHQRRLERFTAEDAGLRARRTALHRGSEPPLLRRFVADREAPPHRG
ncbi:MULTISPECIES: MFS transporter [unclassified Rubrivivax]|uniref:MFS transporter n=1 Tax=unclassified Rubrivivax TaxID=2649762 RepID=UPI001E327B9A|nr:MULTISPECIES: MFS transporter [unclassified Rubrivivax]MCC9597234.1 MFS transporter [Rubrivivax sp. JA1055]MCC9646507.1 MFS transporter [Rubrivivax sp. JA1029]MCD0416792.1 MFS transporter [Rubrivivax sp. JA1024]